MEFIKVEEAVKRIAGFVGLDPTNDQDRLFFYLEMAQKKAWKNGAYKGFLKEFDVNVTEHNGHRYIQTPHGYNVLMGININSKPNQIKDSYFQFHHNSYGSLSEERMLSFVDFTLSYREYPTLRGPQLLSSKVPFKIASTARSNESNSYTTVSGNDPNGNPIYSNNGNTHGVKVLLEKDKAKLLEIWFSEVTAIQKDVTNGPVEYFSVDANNNAELIARIEPHQSRSLYRIYHVPQSCCRDNTLHCLFKISEPDPIVSLEQRLIIDDMESLLSLVIGMDASFDKKDIQGGEAFLAKGIIGLDSENEAGKSPTVQPIQYIGMEVENPDDHFFY